MTTLNSNLRYLWDIFSDGIQAEINEHGPAPESAKNLTVSRENDHRLEVRVGNGLSLHDASSFVAGDRGTTDFGERSEPVVAETESGAELTIFGYVPTGFKDNGEGHVETASCDKIELEVRDTAPAYRIDWVVNFPQSKIIWPRSEARVSGEPTGHHFRLKNARYRSSEGLLSDAFFSLGPTLECRVGGARNHLVFEPSEPSISTVRIGKCVRDGLPQDWSPGFLFYELADAAELESDFSDWLHRALGFLFGRELGLLGSTYFDENKQLVRATGHNPIVHGGKRRVQEIAFQPTRLFNSSEDRHKLLDENVVGRALEGVMSTFQKDEEWAMVIEYFYMARRSSFPTKSVQYSAALEAIASLVAPSSRDVLIPKGDFAPLLNELRQTIDEFSEGFSNFNKFATEVRRIRARLPSLNQASKSWIEQVLDPIRNLGLDIGEVEEDAFVHRHKAAHGDLDRDNFPVSYWRTRALHTLFNRAFLAVTGASGFYRDHSTETSLQEDSPIRQLEHPLGGPCGDGRPASAF